MNDIIIPLSTAILGGLIGTYFGARFLNMRLGPRSQNQI